MTSSPRRIAVWNTAFLGDAVLTLPLLDSVNAAFPRAGLDFYVRPGLAGLFAARPDVRVTEVPRKGVESFLWGTVRPRGHDLWLGAHGSPRAALAALVSGASVRVGYSGGLRTLAYTHRVPRRFGELDEIERLLQLLKPVQALYETGLPADFDPDAPTGVLPDVPTGPFHWPHLVLPAEAEARAAQLWQAHELEGTQVVGLHPGSVWPTKRWGGFAAVARRVADFGARVAVFAGPGEEAMARRMIDDAGLRGSAADFSGALSLPVLAACLKRLSVYVGNDSGPLHLAWCQGTPTTAVFGPTVRELGFFPRGPHATVLEVPASSGLTCRPCGLHGPKVCPLGHHRCMADISPETVWADVRRKLERGHA